MSISAWPRAGGMIVTVAAEPIIITTSGILQGRPPRP
jgi:hypothetical protein